MLLPSDNNERVKMEECIARSRHPDSLGQAFLSALLPALVWFLVAPSVGNAEVVTNITSLPTDPGYLGTTVTSTGQVTGTQDWTLHSLTALAPRGTARGAASAALVLQGGAGARAARKRSPRRGAGHPAGAASRLRLEQAAQAATVAS